MEEYHYGLNRTMHQLPLHVAERIDKGTTSYLYADQPGGVAVPVAPKATDYALPQKAPQRIYYSGHGFVFNASSLTINEIGER
ncbi:hypothetical protein H8B13_09390 [Hymenobacter sp. BT188]|uniref:hypothetical protein n=1 Tax=Hymenobacter sp. BT188 TaxID=2763504 RepID=UPI001651945F|nr:hypothetical protein [Hymenobacter sp. BT188]MBC6607031.1 hypothetical protein [Hymenobacter sp. BT188]